MVSRYAAVDKRVGDDRLFSVGVGAGDSAAVVARGIFEGAARYGGIGGRAAEAAAVLLEGKAVLKGAIYQIDVAFLRGLRAVKSVDVKSTAVSLFGRAVLEAAIRHGHSLGVGFQGARGVGRAAGELAAGDGGGAFRGGDRGDPARDPAGV